MSVTITLASTSSGDWHGMYVDGELCLEGHSLRVDEVLEVLGFGAVEIEAAEDELESTGNHFPEKLDQLKVKE